MRIPSALALLVLLSACDGDGLADRTYPGAGDFPSASPYEIATADSGRYNTTAHVADVFVCPPEADCAAAGSITLAETYVGFSEPDPSALVVWVEAPEQFATGRRGTFSVEVRGASGGTDGGVRWVALLGYDWR